MLKATPAGLAEQAAGGGGSPKRQPQKATIPKRQSPKRQQNQKGKAPKGSRQKGKSRKLPEPPGRPAQGGEKGGMVVGKKKKSRGNGGGTRGTSGSVRVTRCRNSSVLSLSLVWAEQGDFHEPLELSSCEEPQNILGRADDRPPQKKRLWWDFS